MSAAGNPQIVASFLAVPPPSLESLPDGDFLSGWTPLRQSWLAAAPRAGFNPGWARVQWNEHALLYEMAFDGPRFGNRARALNERTWELGDVAEIFVEAAGTGFYSEIHVTPENQRLQLRLPHGAIAEVRAGRRRLEEFAVAQPEWVESAVSARPGRWLVRVRVPAAAVGIDRFAAEMVLSTAVCRYDRSGKDPAPQLSSTASLSAPSFHQREEWSRLRLAAARAG